MRCVALAMSMMLAMATATMAQAQQPAAPKITYDKSLAPDGKPWSGVSLIRYWKSKIPDPTLNFTMVERLELKASEAKKLQWRDGQSGAVEQQNMIDQPQDRLQGGSSAPPKLTAKEAAKLRREKQIAERKARAAGTGKTAKATKAAATSAKTAKAEKVLVYSETPAREALLDRISRQFRIEPDRAIVDFAGDRKKACATQLSKSCEKYFVDPAKYADDEQAQRLYWTDAVEIVDFRGNENAAKEYEKAFSRECKVACYRWYSVVITGDMRWASQPYFLLLGGDNVLVYAGGGLRHVKVEGYQGFLTAGNP